MAKKCTALRSYNPLNSIIAARPSTIVQNPADQFPSDKEPCQGYHRNLGRAVTADVAGERIDAYLAKEYPFLSRAGWQKRIADGSLLVNGMPRKVSGRLREGDLVTMWAPITQEPEVDRNVQVIWEHQGVIAAFKPGNLPMHENGPYKKNTFHELIGALVGREWAAVHRLDRETSGIVLCAATPELRAKLAEGLERRAFKKQYLAIARGAPADDGWTANGPIGDLVESQIRIKKWVVPIAAGGQHAQTHFTVIGRKPEACLLHARPVTGRTNQIRIHAAHHGHVLFGDKLYHPDEAVFLEYFEHGQTENVTERTGFHRLCLHATAMEFTHPGTQERVLVESPLPPDLQGFWDAL